MALPLAGRGGSSNTPFAPPPGSAGGTGSSPPGTVAVTSDATTVPADSPALATDSGFMNITYPEDHAAWVQVQRMATVTAQGTESSTSAKVWPPMLADEVIATNAAIPGRFSRYGQASTCSNPN
jgi:hypothetical protein